VMGIFHFFTRDSIYVNVYDIARPSVCLSVCLSVTRVDHTKTVEVRMMEFSPYGSAIPLVFESKFHPEILRCSPERGR